jgi:hypothetical protein
MEAAEPQRLVMGFRTQDPIDLTSMLPLHSGLSSVAALCTHTCLVYGPETSTDAPAAIALWSQYQVRSVDAPHDARSCAAGDLDAGLACASSCLVHHAYRH